MPQPVASPAKQPHRSSTAKAADFSRSVKFVTAATSKIDKDLKKELRETAFQMWMACYSQQEIAEEVGYTQPAVAEYIKNLQVITNGTGAENDISSENEALTNLQQSQEDEEEEQGGGL